MGKTVKIILIVLMAVGLAVVIILGGGFITKKFIYPLKYKDDVIYCSKEFGVDSALIFAIIKTESGFDKNAVSDRGAVGLMQITERTGKYIASMLNEVDYSLYSPKTNIRFGTFYVKYLLNKFGDLKVALSAYNAGEGNVREWLKDDRYSDDGVTLSEIPFAETNNYVQKTCKSFIKYRKLYSYILDKTK